MSDKPSIPTFENALPIALLRTREAVMNCFRPMLANHGLTEQQWRVIRAIQDQDKITSTELSERCCILMPSLSRMLKSLEKEGLVTRQKVQDDRRRHMLVLSLKGEKLFKIVAPESERIYTEIEAKHGSEETRKLAEALTALHQNLSR